MSHCFECGYRSPLNCTATRTITVVDTTAPVITLLGDNPAEVELGSSYTDAGATTDDGSEIRSSRRQPRNKLKHDFHEDDDPEDNQNEKRNPQDNPEENNPDEQRTHKTTTKTRQRKHKPTPSNTTPGHERTGQQDDPKYRTKLGVMSPAPNSFTSATTSTEQGCNEPLQNKQECQNHSRRQRQEPKQQSTKTGCNEPAVSQVAGKIQQKPGVNPP